MRSLATVFAALATSTVLVLTSPAAPVSAAGVAGSGVAPAAARATSIGTLQATAARTDVVVRGVRRAAQSQWIDQVVDSSLVSLDGCVAAVGEPVVRGGVYRTSVTTLCPGGLARARAAARALVRSRPWYQVSVRPVTVAAFTFTTPVEVGRGTPVEAALAHLPLTASTYVEGDDTSLVFVGAGVSQRQLDLARAAFARELGIGSARVRVSPLRLG